MSKADTREVVKTIWEYTSVQRVHIPGTPYENVNDFLREYGANGWELVSVVMGQKWFVDEQFEIFYFKRPI